jgi:hypothetical protein
VSRHHLSVQADPGGVRVLEVAGVNPVWTVEAGQRVAVRVGQVLAPGGGPDGRGDHAGRARGPPMRSGPPTPARGGRARRDGVISGPPEASRLAALAALGDKLARCGSLAGGAAGGDVVGGRRVAGGPQPGAEPGRQRHPQRRERGSPARPGAVVGAAGRVLRERRAVLLHDVLAEPDLADRRSVQLRGITGAMAAPAEGLIFYVEWGPREALRAAARRRGAAAAGLRGAAGQRRSATAPASASS